MTINRRVLVCNLNYNADERTIRNLFEQAGDIENIDILVDKFGISKGIAYITYKNADDARKSIKMFRKSVFMNRMLDVFFSNLDEIDEPKNQKSFLEYIKTIPNNLQRKNPTPNEYRSKENVLNAFKSLISNIKIETIYIEKKSTHHNPFIYIDALFKLNLNLPPIKF